MFQRRRYQASRARSQSVKRRRTQTPKPKPKPIDTTMEHVNIENSSGAVMTNRSLNVVPNTMKATLHYCSRSIDINPGAAGSCASHVFSANGLYDPDITSTGHQPMGFDNYMALYQDYTVIGSKITIFARSADLTYGQFVGIQLRDDSSVNTDGENIVENGRNVYTHIGQATSGNDLAQVSYDCNLSEFLGLSHIMSCDEARGSASTNPIEQAYYHVFCFPDSVADSAGVRFMAQIDYVVIFSEPRPLATS